MGKGRAWPESVETSDIEMVAMINQHATRNKGVLCLAHRADTRTYHQQRCRYVADEGGCNANQGASGIALTTLSSFDSANSGFIVNNVADQNSKTVFKMNATIAKWFRKAVTASEETASGCSLYCRSFRPAIEAAVTTPTGRPSPSSTATAAVL